MGEIKHLGFSSSSSSSGGGGFHITISATTVLSDVHLGDSIAVNGTDRIHPQFLHGQSRPETLRRTSLNDLKPGSLVNLERALLPSTRLGGHFVQGHVDGTGEIVEKRVEGDSLWVKVRVSDGGELMRFVVPKGYICVDGTSLTVVKVYDEEDCFDFMLVAYTQQKVVVASKGVGEKVNLEVDVLGKYVERILQRGGGGVGGDFKNSA
ncbi:hypothetical protein Scep_011304 [Stephania cephalantha]|uniref:Riboflavin synthase n=1 Tax=Stephania cephalantha TaxID=152367 RepID=A0AAP0JEN1_9MAGN